ncbi:MAG TPA: DegT/DnrJ/EryC1/StrS aminotransferase family protein [bacterium]|nr:DegT/DnrJ/EryC1/StrS aminotransferase family protein [bacterium]
MNIRLFKPSIGEEELQNVNEAFQRSWIGLGPKVTEFEQAWSDFIGCKISIGLNSCTAALHLALTALGFPEGKKVLVPSLTFASTAMAVLYNRLVPVFVDMDQVTLGISLDDLEKKYDADCVAIIPVHYAGHPVPMEKIMGFAKSNGLKVIEDCAHAAGVRYKGKMLGCWGDISCFSFEEKKCMTTGDGGMICSNNPELLKDIKAYRWVGIDKDNWKSAQQYIDSARQDAMHWFYEISLLGYKYNMNDLAASIGLAQLSKLDKMNQRRSDIILRYMKGIEQLKHIELLLPFEPDKYFYQMFGVRCQRRDDLMVFLKTRGIATGCHYTPLTMQPLFKPYSKASCPVAEQEYRKFVTLPLHADLKDEEVDYIIRALSRFDSEY